MSQSAPFVPASHASLREDPVKIKDLCDQGIVPLTHDMKESRDDSEKRKDIFDAINSLAGQAVGGVQAIEPAKKIVDDMIAQAAEVLSMNASMVSRL